MVWYVSYAVVKHKYHITSVIDIILLQSFHMQVDTENDRIPSFILTSFLPSI